MSAGRVLFFFFFFFFSSHNRYHLEVFGKRGRMNDVQQVPPSGIGSNVLREEAELVVNAISVLQTPSSPPVDRSFADKWLQQWQSSSNAWIVTPLLLHSEVGC
jgi:hypothetical protein